MSILGSKKAWLVTLVVTALIIGSVVTTRESCLFNNQCEMQKNQVGWINWLVNGGNGQLHFFNLLELFHNPSQDNHF